MKKGNIKKPEIEVAINLEKLILSIMEKEDTDKVTVKLVNGFWEIEPNKKEKINIRGIYVYTKNKNKKRQ